MHRAIHLQGCFSHPETWDGSENRLDVREGRARSEGPARDGVRKVGTSLVAQWSALPTWGAQLQCLVRELRSRVPSNVAPKNK